MQIHLPKIESIIEQMKSYAYLVGRWGICFLFLRFGTFLDDVVWPGSFSEFSKASRALHFYILKNDDHFIQTYIVAALLLFPVLWSQEREQQTYTYGFLYVEKFVAIALGMITADVAYDVFAAVFPVLSKSVVS